MSLKTHSHDEIKKMSMIELAYLYLLDEKKGMNFKDLFAEVAKLKGFTKKEKEENISQLYTDLNMDGRFTKAESNEWGLKRWYPVKVKKVSVAKVVSPKKKRKVVDKEVDDDMDTEFDDEDDEFIDEAFDDFDEDFDEDDEDEEEERI